MDRYRELKALVESMEAAEQANRKPVGAAEARSGNPVGDFRVLMEQAKPTLEAAAEPGSYGEDFQVLVEELNRMFLYKSSANQYGTAFTQTGVLGAVVALVGDVARLQQMVLRKDGHGRSNAVQVEDKLRDIAVQSIIGLMMLQENNWEGKF